MHKVLYFGRLTKTLILILEGILKKISYERRDYESVDEKILSEAMSRKTKKIKTSCSNGLITINMSQELSIISILVAGFHDLVNILEITSYLDK